MGRPVLFTSNPCEGSDQWYVWDTYEPLPPKPVFFGSMEEAGGVADALNARIRPAPVSGEGE